MVTIKIAYTFLKRNMLSETRFDNDFQKLAVEKKIFLGNLQESYDFDLTLYLKKKEDRKRRKEECLSFIIISIVEDAG